MFRGLDVGGGRRDPVPVVVADREPLDVTVYVRRDLDAENHERVRWLRDRLDRLSDAGVVTTVRTITFPAESGPVEDIGLLVREGSEPLARYPSTSNGGRSLEDGVAALRTGEVATNSRGDDTPEWNHSIREFEPNERVEAPTR